MQVVDANHGFTLSEMNGASDEENLRFNVGQNELSAVLNSGTQRLYWSLPNTFLGNKVTWRPRSLTHMFAFLTKKIV